MTEEKKKVVGNLLDSGPGSIARAQGAHFAWVDYLVDQLEQNVGQEFDIPEDCPDMAVATAIRVLEEGGLSVEASRTTKKIKASRVN